MGSRNKLLMRDASGRTMIGRVVHAVLASRASEAVLVMGHEAAAVAQAARQAAGSCGRLRFVHAPDFATGLSASLKCGVDAMSDVMGALVCLGDMPLVTGEMLDRLIDAFDPGSGRTIVVPTCQGVRGNPVLWGRHFHGAFRSLSGDRGARGLLASNAASIVEVEIGDLAILQDFDTPEAFGADWRDPSPP
jgi:molybdenum cofactor cytidylyltransferase